MDPQQVFIGILVVVGIVGAIAAGKGFLKEIDHAISLQEREEE